MSNPFPLCKDCAYCLNGIGSVVNFRTDMVMVVSRHKKKKDYSPIRNDTTPYVSGTQRDIVK